jgi:hypothetical protein
MASRERTTGISCGEGGCREVSWRSYTSQKAYGEIMRAQAAKPWKCSRHEHPERNLRPGNTTTSYVVVATRLPFRLARGSEPEWLPGLFWCPEGGPQTGSGYAFGPGFNAHASDVPEGTRLIVTAVIELPPVTGEDGTDGDRS